MATANGGYPASEMPAPLPKMTREGRPQLLSCKSGELFGPEDDAFLLGSKLGKGGQGTVFICTRMETGSKYAVKIIDVEAMNFNKKQSENLRREIRNMQELHHPRIVNLHAAIWDRGQCLLVMDLAAGGDLHGKIEGEVKDQKQAQKPEPFSGLGGSEVCSKYVTLQLIDGVAYMHSKHIIHRDLKLENVLIKRTHMSSDAPPRELHDVKIADLGLSTYVGKEKLEDATPQPMMVSRRSIVGTPDFVAPEVLEATYDERADLWSLGVMVYAMFCGTWPFEIKSQEDLRPERHKEIVASIKDSPSWGNVSDQGKSFVQGLLTVDPSTRLSLVACKAHPWLLDVDKPQMVSIPRTLSTDDGVVGVIKKVNGWYGNAVDSLHLRLTDGSTQSYGSRGGEAEVNFSLQQDEVVLAVMQETRAQYLGNSITLYTSRGQVINVKGIDAKRRRRFVAPGGCQVVGLQFDGSRLVGTHVERMTSGHGSVEKIGGKVGYAVDEVWFKLRSGESRSYGTPGGQERGPFELDADDYIVVVEQGWRDAFLGNSIVFYTKSGNVISLIGMESTPARRLAIPNGKQLCGLQFAGSQLDAVWICPSNGDLSKKENLGVKADRGNSFRRLP